MSAIVTPDRELRIFGAAELRIRTTEKTKVIEGYAAKFNVRSHDFGGWVEVISPGAFARAIVDDDVEMLYDHGLGGGITLMGRSKNGTLRLKEDRTGLWFENDVPNTSAGRDVLELLDRGDLKEMSFGFRARQPGGDEWSFEGPLAIRTLKDVSLFDVSITVKGQYPDTEVALRSRDAWRKTQHIGADAMRLARLRLAEAED